MKRIRFLPPAAFMVALLAALLLAVVALAASSIPRPPKSYYTDRILKFLDHWPPPTADIQDPRPVIVRAILTPGQPNIIGLIKHFTVNFPLQKVAQTTEDFENYPQIWRDVLSVHVEAREKDGQVERVLTDWVLRRPAFFMPKVRYRMLYTIDRSGMQNGLGRVVFHQQLIDGNNVASTDALVVDEAQGAGKTRISVLDFFTPELGALRSLIGGTIWLKSMEHSFEDDIAFRTRLEHPDWSVNKISRAADRALESKPFREIQYAELPELNR